MIPKPQPSNGPPCSQSEPSTDPLIRNMRGPRCDSKALNLQTEATFLAIEAPCLIQEPPHLETAPLSLSPTPSNTLPSCLLVQIWSPKPIH